MPNTSSDPLTRPDQPRLTIVIVNFNGWSDVVSLVKILALSPQVVCGQCELVIVDNASDESPPAFFDHPQFGIHLIVRPQNGGFAVGVNEGWRASRSPWLLLLNPDVQAGPEMIGEILDRVDFHESRTEQAPAIVGFGLRNPDGTHQPSVGAKPGLLRSLAGQFIPRSRRNYQADWRTRPGPVSWVTGACMLVESAFLNEVGGMDEEFFLYYEEVSLCQKAWERCRRVEYDDSVSIVHLRPLQNRTISPKIRIIVRHAKLLFFRKHQTAWQFWTLCRVVQVESRIRGLLSKLRRHETESRSWKAIGAIARSMLRGNVPTGRAILLLAERATAVPVTVRKPHVVERLARSVHDRRDRDNHTEHCSSRR